MSSAEALVAALTMLHYPHLTGRARESSLPKGVTFLLQVAAGEAEALSEAQALTGQTEKNLGKAAGFFVEQVLLSAVTDRYRVLGCDRKASNADLRRHMALIMKWLHPDIVGADSPASGFDRSLYVNRVTEAWEALKTEDRRLAYDAVLLTHKQDRQAARLQRAGLSFFAAPSSKDASVSEGMRRQAPYRRRAKPAGLLSRMFSIFAGRL